MIRLSHFHIKLVYFFAAQPLIYLISFYFSLFLYKFERGIYPNEQLQKGFAPDSRFLLPYIFDTYFDFVFLALIPTIWFLHYSLTLKKTSSKPMLIYLVGVSLLLLNLIFDPIYAWLVD